MRAAVPFADWGLCGPASGRLVAARPARAESALTNADEVVGAVCLVERGGGKFLNVARRCAAAGAAAVVIVNSDDSILSMNGPDDLDDRRAAPALRRPRPAWRASGLNLAPQSRPPFPPRALASPLPRPISDRAALRCLRRRLGAASNAAAAAGMWAAACPSRW